MFRFFRLSSSFCALAFAFSIAPALAQSNSAANSTPPASAPSKIDRPVHELKGFERVELRPGESKTVEFRLDRAALSYWNPATKAWQADPGTFEVQVGASSCDIRLRAPLELK